RSPPDIPDAAMKSDIHPNYHPIKVIMTDGTEYTTRSTYRAEGDVLRLDIDSKTHPAWTGGAQKLPDRGGRGSRFNSRFAGLMGAGGAASGAATDAAPAKKKR